MLNDYFPYHEAISQERLNVMAVRGSRVLHYRMRRAGSPHGDLQLLLADGGLLFTWSSHSVGGYQVRLDPGGVEGDKPDHCPDCGDDKSLVHYPGHQATISMCGDNWQQDYAPLWVCTACFWISDMLPVHRESPPVTDDGGREFDPYWYDRHPM